MSTAAQMPAHLDLVKDGPAASRALVCEILATCGDHQLVDHATAQGEGWLEVTWTPPADGPWYRTDGHGRRLLMPGTVTTELAVQAGELLIYALDGGRRPEDGVPVLGRITKARFTGPVAPGEPLFAKVVLRQRLGPAFYVDATVRTKAGKVMSARLTFTATEAMNRWLDGAR